jgi:hypothetical protein
MTLNDTLNDIQVHLVIVESISRGMIEDVEEGFIDLRGFRGTNDRSQ